MTDSERDEMIMETHTDMKWVKEWAKEHRASHRQYMYYFIATAIGLLIAIVK